MPTFLANPFGLLGLLAIPAILLIHMLREKTQTFRVSTLFLLPHVAPRTPRGRAIRLLQNSVPLWLQLLAALLCTWLLADPRWISSTSFQSVALILDSTASMSAAKPRVMAELPETLRTLARQAGRTEWTVSSSDSPGRLLYRGMSLREALAALDQWQPLLPRHDPSPAFATALANARSRGTILFISDENPEALPAGITLLAYGQPMENCGISGVRVWQEGGANLWEALVKNSGSAPQVRQWWFEAGNIRTRPETLNLAPGQLATIRGPFPGGEKHLHVHLSPDEFTLDDELPLVALEAKEITVTTSAAIPEATLGLVKRLLKTLPNINSVAEENSPALLIAPVEELGPATGGQWAIGLGAGKEPSAPNGLIVAEKHRLMEGLVWDGLLSRGPGSLVPAAEDEPLLWQGETVLIFLRGVEGGGKQLILNFDVATSNADRLPAFVLLLGRFVEEARAKRVNHSAENFETGQTIPVATSGPFEFVQAGVSTAMPLGNLRAPLLPGFFLVRKGGKEILDGAAHFGDPRESDFKGAVTQGMGDTSSSIIRETNSLPDPFANLWLLLAAAALVGSWVAHSRSLALEPATP